MNANFIFLYTSEQDPIVKAAKKACSSKTVFFIHVDDLLPYFSRGDWPKVIVGVFPKELRQLFKDAIVVNRLFSFKHTKLNELAASAGCTSAWLHAQLWELLRYARELCYDTGAPGVSSSLLPLPTQWLRIKQRDPGLAIPQFAYGFGQQLPGLSGLKRPVRRTIWSIFDWRPEQDPSEVDGPHAFFVDRPDGEPVLIYYFGDSYQVVHMGDVIDIPPEKIATLMSNVREVFKSATGEILTFVVDNEITFAAFSPHMETPSNDKNFDFALRTWMDRLVATCPVDAAAELA